MASMSVEFDGLSALFGDSFPREGTVQEIRREDMLDTMLNIAEAAKVAAALVNEIVEEHEDRMQLDDEGQLIIVGQLAIYRVDVNAFMVGVTDALYPTRRVFDMRQETLIPVAGLEID